MKEQMFFRVFKYKRHLFKHQTTSKTILQLHNSNLKQTRLLSLDF